MGRSTVDLTVLRISGHAADRYHERVSPRRRMPVDEVAADKARRSAKRRLATLLRYAEPLHPVGEEGSHAWKLYGCVALERAGTLTTIITDAMYERTINQEAS